MQNRKIEQIFTELAFTNHCLDREILTYYERIMKEDTASVQNPETVIRRERNYIRF